MPTILVTGFGPFPGAPFNPTGPLAERLARLRRASLGDTRIAAHVFPTSYAAVDRDLPKLIARHTPDALLMFGLAPRARVLRVEMRARNTLALLPDAGGAARAAKIAAEQPAALALRAPAQGLLGAIRAAHLPAALSRDAGRYLCNYLCWRATETTRGADGPRIAAFVHVPPVRRKPRPRGGRPQPSMDDLTRAGARLVVAISAALRRNAAMVRPESMPT